MMIKTTPTSTTVFSVVSRKRKIVLATVPLTKPFLLVKGKLPCIGASN